MREIIWCCMHTKVFIEVVLKTPEKIVDSPKWVLYFYNICKLFYVFPTCLWLNVFIFLFYSVSVLKEKYKLIFFWLLFLSFRTFRTMIVKNEWLNTVESSNVYGFVLTCVGKIMISFGATTDELITFKRWNSSEKAFRA